MSEIQNKAKFDFIRYSNCWEDADILLEGLRIKEGEDCLSVASAGDNTLSMLVYNPKSILAVDINKVQLACLELKMAAFKHLDYNKVLELIGVLDSNNRLDIFNNIKHDISETARNFFQINNDIIVEGLIFAGKMERYFRLFRKILIPLIHSRKTVKNLLKAEDLPTQRKVYFKKVKNIRFKLFYNIFCSRLIMGKLGRDPKFFDHVEGNVPQRLMMRIEKSLTNVPTRNNPYVHYILGGTYPVNILPHYLRKENFDQIKHNINRISIFHGTVNEAIRNNNKLKFNAFNLSNIFEYMSEKEFRNELALIRDSAEDGARLVYWNNLADRDIPDDVIGINKNKVLSAKLSAIDKILYYDSFIVCEID